MVKSTAYVDIIDTKGVKDTCVHRLYALYILIIFTRYKYLLPKYLVLVPCTPSTCTP